MASPDSSNHWLEYLAPEVAGFRFAHFRLGNDLRQLVAVQGVGATEAVILYCARILEVLAAAALDAIDLDPTTNVCSNLITLEEYNLLPKQTRYWAHSLRRLGNAARHVHSAHQADDANLALCFAERWLGWFFRDFAYGQRLARLTRSGPDVELSADPRLTDALTAIDRFAASPAAGVADFESQLGPALLTTAAMPALVAELLIDRSALEPARTLLEQALARHASDLRLRQLLGLAWSRSGNAEEARRWLEPLLTQFPDDEESLGICAGVYKRVWQSDPKTNEWLRKSNGLYRRGWDHSRKANPYLGINAATTALWLGETAEAQQLAGQVRNLLGKRVARMARGGKSGGLALGYWDQVTLAEARLVEGEFQRAADEYRQAVARYGKQTGNIEQTRRQMEAIVAALHVPDAERRRLSDALTGSTDDEPAN